MAREPTIERYIAIGRLITILSQHGVETCAEEWRKAKTPTIIKIINIIKGGEVK